MVLNFRKLALADAMLLAGYLVKEGAVVTVSKVGAAITIEFHDPDPPKPGSK